MVIDRVETYPKSRKRAQEGEENKIYIFTLWSILGLRLVSSMRLCMLSAFFKENTLLAQPFVKDQSKTVGDYLKSVDSSAKVTHFKRVQLG